MITEFTVENFRLFNHLHLPNLSRVNLIVGKNSVGKSAVLEALRLYFSNLSQQMLLEILKSRQEHLSHQDFLDNYKQHPCRHLFPHRIFTDLGADGIRFSTNLDAFELFLSLYSKREDGQLTQIELEQSNRYSPETLIPYVVVRHQQDTHPVIPLITPANLIAQSSFKPLYEHSHRLFNYIPVIGVTEQQIVRLWSNVNLRDSKSEIIKGLQLINPDVVDTDVSFLDDVSRIPLVRLASENEPRIISSLGDGMVRIFQIILSLVCSKDGVLLIDEFETGLHWSVQQQAWELIFTLAEKLNVQVFVTTHSKDCVESFNQVWGYNPQQGSFYRLYRDQDKIEVQDYDSELLSDSVDTDTEVR